MIFWENLKIIFAELPCAAALVCVPQRERDYCWEVQGMPGDSHHHHHHHHQFNHDAYVWCDDDGCGGGGDICHGTWNSECQVIEIVVMLTSAIIMIMMVLIMVIVFDRLRLRYWCLKYWHLEQWKHDIETLIINVQYLSMPLIPLDSAPSQNINYNRSLNEISISQKLQIVFFLACRINRFANSIFLFLSISFLFYFWWVVVAKKNTFPFVCSLVWDLPRFVSGRSYGYFF